MEPNWKILSRTKVEIKVILLVLHLVARSSILFVTIKIFYTIFTIQTLSYIKSAHDMPRTLVHFEKTSGFFIKKLVEEKHGLIKINLYR